MLELVDITKVYRGGKRAVDAVTMRLETGMLGPLGPNGAGKSSLMRIASTVTRPTDGRVLFHGTDVVARPGVVRRSLGCLPQDFGVYLNLTSREFLSYLAAAKGLSARSARVRIDELLQLVNLTEAVKRPLGTYSGGMLRRVGIAQALLADPEVVVDEPTAASICPFGTARSTASRRSTSWARSGPTTAARPACRRCSWRRPWS